MIDTYLCSGDKGAIEALCQKFSNVLGPVPGLCATAEQTMSEDILVPAQEAIGDPSVYYACIRTDSEVIPESPVELCQASVVNALVGIWAA